MCKVTLQEKKKFNFKTKKEIYFCDPTKANSVFTVFFLFFFLLQTCETKHW